MKTTGLFCLLLACAAPASADTFSFGTNHLVVSVEGRGTTAGTYTDNQAAPLSLFDFAHVGTSSATFSGALVLPQTASGRNSAISGEYGSSSEGMLQRSADGRYLTIMGYGVNAAAFNANPTAYGTLTNDPTKPTALGQSGSLTGQSYTAVSRVVARIGGNASVDTSTALYNVYNGNNPRSVYTLDGSTFYTSGQGTGKANDKTGGVFYATLGSATATAITGADSAGKTIAQDTRVVTVYNNQLYVSADSKQGSGNNRDFIGTLGAQGALPTGLVNNGGGPTMLAGFGNSGGTGKFVVTTATANGIVSAGKEINLSPESFFFANDTTLYVADSGIPKNDSASGSKLGLGGLQKWVKTGNTWTMAYTLSAGLDLVANTASSGTTGLLGLTGQVVGDTVQLFATNYTAGDLDQTYLFGISDSLGATQRQAGQQFTKLAAAPADSNFKGVAIAPVPEPGEWAMMIAGLGVVGGIARRRR